MSLLITWDECGMSAPPASSRILLIESDQPLARRICADLIESGYDVATVTDAEQGLRQVSSFTPALIVVDRMLAGTSGLIFCRLLRKQGVQTPVVLMMARDKVEDRTACLDVGADDYFLKPYRTDDFLSAVNLYLRPQEKSVEQLRFGDLTLDVAARHAVRRSRIIELTVKEFELLRYFMEHPRTVLTREQILENVWGYDFMGESNVIEVYIRYLRLKIEQDSEKRLIQTVRGVGYVLRES
ncbi:MAG: response regulator transcription factor [Cyanobacteria bacterium P01_A01_bin.135]